MVDVQGRPSVLYRSRSDGSNLNFISRNDLACRLQHDTPATPSPPGSPPGSPLERRLLLLDLRSMFLFQESHVRDSINLSNCALVCKRIQDGKLQIKEYLEARLLFDGSQDIVIYEQCGCPPETAGVPNEEQEEGWSRVTEFAKLIFNNLKNVSSESAKVKILQGGFDKFRKSFPEYCTVGVPFVTRVFFSDVHDDESTFLNWEATQIRHNIYVGALHDAKNEELLDRLNITHILNCSKTDSRGHDDQNRFKYLELKCDDNLQQSLDGKLDTAFQFINDAVNENGKVLIHCYAGVSRSAAITIAYMMHAFNLTYQESYRELKEKRSIVAPNLNFVAQLMKFDDLRKGERELPTKSCGATSVPQPNLRKESAPPSTGPVGGGLAAKRKMLLPLNIKVPPAQGFDSSLRLSVGSAPLLESNYNPFSSAFKDANSCDKPSFQTFPPFENKSPKPPPAPPFEQSTFKHSVTD